MKTKEKLEQALYHNYREFIEFLNDLYLPHIIKLILIYIPLITIFGDLLNTIEANEFWQNISNLTPSQFLFNLIMLMPWLLTLVKVIIMILLNLPAIFTMGIFAWSCAMINKDEIEIGYFSNFYRKSSIFRIFRIYTNSFQKLFFPILLSLGCKIMKTYPAIGVIFIVFSFINSFIYNYYDLEIPFPKQKHSIKQINFTNSVIESFLVLFTIIIINFTHGIVPFVCSLTFFAIRILTNHFLQFEALVYKNESIFCLLCAFAISFALMIGFLIEQYFIMAVCACISILVLIQTRSMRSENKNIYYAVETISPEEDISIKLIKQDLLEEKITKAYRNAVLLSRVKNSHRDQLTIDVLKSKAYDLERVSRGSIKTANSLDVLSFESKVIKIINNMVLIESKAIEALSLMKSKEPKQEMLVKIVSELVNLIDENKIEFIKCLEINAIAHELRILMELFFRKLYNDTTFIRETKNKIQEENLTINHRMIQKQLFNKDKALVVLNVLDEVGKISRVSNNLPNVLGYTSNSLIGLSINELIPFTVRKQHDKILTNFVTNFTSEIARKKPYVDFYAYDKEFHLQKVEIKYKFFLHYFQNFELSGIIHKAKTEDYLIITDEFGNIEGWSTKVGDLFNFDEISGNDCCVYNLLPMIPACVKFDNTTPVCLKSVLFRLSKMKTSKLMLFDLKKGVPTMEEMKKKQNEAFYDIFQSGEFLEGFVANIEIDPITFGGCDKIIKLFKFYELRRIENFEILEDMVLFNEKETKKYELGLRFDPSYPQIEKSLEESEDGDYSMERVTVNENYRIDLNFSLDLGKPSHADSNILKFTKDLDRFQSTFFSRSLLKVEFDEEKENAEILSENLAIESTFDPRLERNSSFVWIVALISLASIGIMISDIVSVSNIFTKLETNKMEIKKANKAEMIYCKTVFNPNETYINEFKNGNLLFFSNWLIDENSTYITFDDKVVTQNLFYLLNVQIPSTLERIVRLQNSKYEKELETNFKNVIENYEKTYSQFKEEWSGKTDEMKRQVVVIIIILSFGIVIYELFLVFIYRRYKNQMKMTEAFFKFEKVDLDEKINGIKWVGSILEKKCEEWFIDQVIHHVKKVQKKESIPRQAETSNEIKKELVNSISLKSIKIKEKKGKIKEVNELEIQIEKKRLYMFIAIILFVFITQVLFLVLQGVLASKLQEDLNNSIDLVDKASKLAVYPNLMMANLTYPVKQEILINYQNSISEILNSPSGLINEFINLLMQPPCKNCTFLPQILNTNYRSFYSYFMNTIVTYNSSTNLTDLYYAVDVVTSKITPLIITENISAHYFVWFIYFFSLAVFFGCVFSVLSELEEKCAKLECFLKFFNIETLMKNKHMSTVMAKNM